MILYERQGRVSKCWLPDVGPDLGGVPTAPSPSKYIWPITNIHQRYFIVSGWVCKFSSNLYNRRYYVIIYWTLREGNGYYVPRDSIDKIEIWNKNNTHGFENECIRFNKIVIFAKRSLNFWNPSLKIGLLSI